MASFANRPIKGALLAVSGHFLVTACQWLEPRSVKVGMPAYNAGINDTGHRLLLLNLVRMRYSEGPYFMEISNVFPEHQTFKRVAETLAGLERKRLLAVISENRGVAQGNKRGMNKKQTKFIEFSIDPAAKQKKYVQQLLEDLKIRFVEKVNPQAFSLEDFFCSKRANKFNMKWRGK